MLYITKQQWTLDPSPFYPLASSNATCVYLQAVRSAYKSNSRHAKSVLRFYEPNEGWIVSPRDDPAEIEVIFISAFFRVFRFHLDVTRNFEGAV